MRKYLLAGVLVWVPVVITLWVLKTLINFMDQSMLLVPARFRPEALFGFNIPGLGTILTVLIVFVTGALAANFFGKRLLSLGDSIMGRIPIVRSIYSGVKQISDTLFSSDGKAFRKAVLIRYPQHDTWTVALLTGEPEHEVTDHLGKDNYSVFIPTTPNITAGFFLIVPKRDVHELEMSVDEALKYIISMGVAEPARHVVADAMATLTDATITDPSHTNGAEMKKSGTDPNPKP
jgi:uncharacterized membrane protein